MCNVSLIAVLIGVINVESNWRWSTIAWGAVEGGQRSPWSHVGGWSGIADHALGCGQRSQGAHVGGGQGSPAVHWDAVNDRRGCIEMCLPFVYLCSHFVQAGDTKVLIFVSIFPIVFFNR